MNFFSLFKRNLIYKFKKKISIDEDTNEKKSLDDLFYFYGSDKANIFRLSNEKGHGYSLFYEEQLQHFKKKELKVLEIGSYAGASAAAFAKYFPNSDIFCLDINISNFKYVSKNIEVFGVDVKNEEKVRSILEDIFKIKGFKGFDLIIDDGSHLLSDIIYSLNFFFKYLNYKGIYVIEDYKFPNYFKRNKDCDELLVDQILVNLKEKKHFLSKVINQDNQRYLFKSIKSIDVFKGNLDESDICFINKN